jgi:hypothetical protein
MNEQRVGHDRIEALIRQCERSRIADIEADALLNSLFA